MKRDQLHPWRRGALSLTGAILMLASLSTQAEEGMWIPLLIERYQMESMQEAGLRLSAEEIYSINQDCLKDAVVRFSRGCTGEMISGEGLLLTNHHCADNFIVALSSLEKDYLTRGYWAMGRGEELPVENLSVTFLRYMRDVTEEMKTGIIQGMDPQDRERQLDLNMGNIIQKAVSGTHLDGEVKPFYYGNSYYLFVYEVFRDIRLVGAPPLSIGNFGGDQDNWIWPRHSGDFTLFRVYADENNQPAVYNPSNHPYRPRKFLEIAAGGVEKGDFTMVLGYPGSTTRYLYSDGVRLQQEQSLPLKIHLRSQRLNIMERYMQASDQVWFQYAVKHGSVSNSWKKWQGVVRGLQRNHVVERKREEEIQFQQWINGDDLRVMKYDGLLDDFKRLYAEMVPYRTAMDLMAEALEPVELFRQILLMRSMMRQGQNLQLLENQIDRFYAGFHLPVDRDIFAAMMETCETYMPESFLPDFFRDIHRKYKGDFHRFAEAMYSKSMFGKIERVNKLLDLYAKDPGLAVVKLENDPLADCLFQFRMIFFVHVNPEYYRLQDELEKHYSRYMEALISQSSDRLLYPDANATMRLTYGNIKGYQPRDGAYYHHTTTLAGLMEKGQGMEEDPAFTVSDRLMQLYRDKDYGRYGVDGTMPVCFIASNHTSGGNSGSPVLDADGRLIGINFDRNWEGTMSDIMYDPSLCRNIAVDIRYVLFIIDKYAGAGHLLDEMNINW